MINLETGEIEFNGVVITPHCTLADLNSMKVIKLKFLDLMNLPAPYDFLN